MQVSRECAERVREEAADGRSCCKSENRLRLPDGLE
jgi:hypothetical protein